MGNLIWVFVIRAVIHSSDTIMKILFIRSSVCIKWLYCMNLFNTIIQMFQWIYKLLNVRFNHYMIQLHKTTICSMEIINTIPFMV